LRWKPIGLTRIALIDMCKAFRPTRRPWKLFVTLSDSPRGCTPFLYGFFDFRWKNDQVRDFAAWAREWNDKLEAAAIDLGDSLDPKRKGRNLVFRDILLTVQWDSTDWTCIPCSRRLRP
jgi:hypothetical protein